MSTRIIEELDPTEVRADKKVARISLKSQNTYVSEDSVVKLNALNLKNLRLAKSYTLERLGELSGLSTSYISRLEAAARRMNAQTLNRLARALECSPTNFFVTDNSKNAEVEKGFKKNVPVYRVIPAGASVENNAYSIIFLTEPIDHVFNLPQFIARESVFAIYAINDDYYPRFSTGSLLYFDSLEAPLKNDFILVIDNDNCLFMGVLLKKTAQEIEIEISSKEKIALSLSKVKQISTLLSIMIK